MTIQEIIESENWKRFIEKLEKLSALILLFGFVLVALKINLNISNIFLVMGFSTLAMVYFFVVLKNLDQVKRFHLHSLKYTVGD
jgi:hypothetical protein